MTSPDTQTQTAPPPPPPFPPTTATAAPPPPPEKRSAGVKAGIALIVIGAVLLLAQFVPGVSWWQLWPLIIVVAGIVQAVTPGSDGWDVNRLFEGIVTIAIGLVFLAIVTGLLSWQIWAVLFTLWPVLLVSFGLELLGKAMKAPWIKAIGSVAVLLAIAYAVAVSWVGADAGWPLVRATGGETVELSEPVGGVERASLRLDAGVATIDLEGGSGGLVEGTASSPFGTPTLEVDRTGDSADVELRMGERDGTVTWPGDAGADLEARLSNEVLWDIRLQTGVATLDADLSDVQVERLVLSPGVTDVKVRMGEPPAEGREARVEVRSGVSSIRIELPSGVEARIESASGLTGHDIDASFRRVDGGWESEGYDRAKSAGRPTWVVILKSGVGSVDIDTY